MKRKSKNRPFYKHLRDPVTKIWLNHIYLNAHKYQYGWMQITTGGVRSGKSMTICTEAELLSDRPLDDYSFAFTPKQYIKSLDNMDRIGEVLIWSELGTALNARKWQSLSNILVTEIIQTMMIKKPIVLIDTPDMSFVDVQCRKLLYSYTEAKRWENSPVKLWVYRISVNRKIGKTYFPHPVVKVGNSIMKLRSINIRTQTPKDIWIKYDEKQKEYKDRLRKKNLKVIEIMEHELVGEKKTIYDMINEVQKDRPKFTSKGRLSYSLIQTHMNVSERKALQIRNFIEKGDSMAKEGENIKYAIPRL